MRNFLLLLAVAVGFANTALSQTDITIGTGTTGNTGTGYPCPIQDWYEGSRAQYLYKVSELNAAGMFAGNINGIKFNVVNLNTFSGDIQLMQIKIGTTSATGLTNTWETVTPVWGPIDYVATLGINTFTFSSPFFWNGTDNIVVEVCNGLPTNTTDGVIHYTNNVTVPWTTGLSFNGSHTYRLDNAGNLCGAADIADNGLGSQTTRPNIIFNWTPATPCNGMPTPGTPNVTPSTVCLGDPISLNSTGVTVASGLNYQWEVSTTGPSSGFSPIAGATTISATTTQTVTSWYRLKVTCTNTGDIAYTAPGAQVTSPPVLGGNYTIDKTVTNPALLFPNTSTFKSFNDAYDAIKCGISSAVVFNVAPGTGPYNEQLIMSSVKGASATNTVTFNGNSNIITFAGTTTTERAIIKLKGAKHIRFDNLVINANAGSFGYGVQLMNNADSNVVSHCTINASLTDITQNYAGIVINGTDAGPVSTGTVLCDSNSFVNNTIIGGYYGITLVATYTGGANGNNRFYGNDIKEFYNAGIYAAGSYSTIIDSNFFSRPTRANVGDFNGILFTTEKNTACTVSRNRISSPFGGLPGNTTLNAYGINFNNSDGSVGAETMVFNNIIYKMDGNGPVYGINNTGSDYVYYMHNTISLDEGLSTSSALTRGFSQQTAASGIIFYNNLITIKRGGTGTKHCIYLGANVLSGEDFNNYYINAAAGSNYIGYFGGDKATLALFQAATSQEAASVSTDPVYTDVNNGITGYTPVSSAMNDKGTPGLGVDFDILNNPRSATTPDIGAHEYSPPPCTVPPPSGTASVSPTPICPNNPVQLKLTIGLFGSGQTFQWQSSTNLGGPFTTNVSSPMIVTDTVIMSPAVTTYYRVAATCGGSTTYSNVVQLTVTPALPGGTYVINKNVTLPANLYPNTNVFKSFNDAKAEMLTCGILGPVVFNVAAGTGPYNEQFVLPFIQGTSATNTITFNGNGNTIAYSGSVTSERAVIKLNGAKYVTFNNLTINSVGAGAYGYGVQLINNADSNRFAGCTIMSSTAAAFNSNYAGVVINSDPSNVNVNGSTLCDGNEFDNNIINGGNYGVTIVGSNAEPIKNNKFTNNIVREFLGYGFFISGTESTLIEGNTITRPTRTVLGNPVAAIYMAAAPNNKLVVTRNRITKMFNGSPTNGSQFSGIYHNSVNQTAGNENIISNNAIYDVQGSGIQYALYNIGSSGVHYYHNTISLDNTASSTGTTRGFYQTTTATNIQFKNNIITIKRGGTSAAATKYGMYLETPGSGITSDYNDFYINGAGTNNYIGYYNGNIATLASWKITPGKDANSLNVDPLYVDITTGNLMPQMAPLDDKGTPIASVPVDILQVSRNATTPDIGAWEFAPPACSAPPTAGTASVTPSTGVCLDAAIVLNITGHSPLGQITFQWQTSPTGAPGTWTNIGPLQYTPQFNTTTTTSTYFRAEVTCNGVSSYTAPVQVNLNNILLAGTYDIGAGATTYVPGTGMTSGNFATWQEAVSAMLCGIGGTVVFNVAPGTYNERISIPNIPGTNANSTVTFQSANGNPASAELTYSADAANNYTLRLIDAKYFRFRNLTFTGQNVNAGRVVELANTASNDSIVNCVINAPVTSNTANTTAGIYVSAIKGTNLTLKGNNISNGANGIYFAGTSTTNLAIPGHLIDSNTVTNAYSHGIYVQYTNAIRVTRNTVNINTTIAAGSAGINLNYADSAYRIMYNKVNVSNNIASGYGIQVANSHSVMRDSGIVASNTIYAGSGLTNTFYGLAITSSRCLNVVNNVVGINSAGGAASGIHHVSNLDSINYYNNTCNITAASANGYAGYFNQSGAGYFRVYNNIFSNSGGGKAVFYADPTIFKADYNMLYTSGANLAQTSTGPVTNFTGLKAWYTSFPIDRWSISYPPAFNSNSDLRPNLANPDVWAMHGRGVQLQGNSYDFNGAVRPETLTAGVPDLGAYEFFPTAQPTVLSAVPASPAPNITQTFYYGTDTVAKITWKAVAPPSVEVKRFSGVVPSGLGVRPDSMYFYVKVDIPGGGAYDYDMKLNYIQPWQGSIPQERQIGLARVTPGGSWVVGFTSKVDTYNKIISQSSINYLDRFSGLINPYAPPVIADKDSSNRGRRFWVAYAINQLSGGQDMYLYLSAQEATNVRVKIYSTTFNNIYPVAANSVAVVGPLPKTGANNAFLNAPGLFDQGIEITSEAPIVAYAHCTGAASSGAVMLLPVGVWGYDYKTLGITQDYGANSFSYFYVIADSNNTKIEVTPSIAVQNAGFPVGSPTQVVLNKGQVLQIVSTSQGPAELSGSTVRSIPNSAGKCYPIAVFSGSSRTAIDVGQCGSGGDFIMQQNFPSTAWGKKYLTAPTSLSNDATIFANNIFRVAVKDPTTIVKRNGVVLSPLINNHYYQFSSTTPDYIEADKPIMVAQFEGGACALGDPEMFYISPMEQGINNVGFYRNTDQAIQVNYLTLIVPTAGLSSLVITDGSTVVTPDYVISHPQNALTGGNYSVVVKRWTAAKQQVRVTCDYDFTAITYGQGSVESYGYNAGTKVKNLHGSGRVENIAALNPPDYNCAGTPFNFVADFPLLPTSVTFKLSSVPGIAPATDTTVNNPVPVSVGTYPNGDPKYVIKLNKNYVITTLGIIPIPIEWTHPDIEGCDHKALDTIYVQVLPTPRTDFSISNPVCEGNLVQFNAQNYTSNGVSVNQWDWTFHTGATASGQNTSFTYPTAGTYNVNLHSVSPDGCIGDSVKQVVVNPLPSVAVVTNSISVCPGSNATFNVQSPLAGATYNWYTSATGGSPLTTSGNIVIGTNGTSITINNVAVSADYYVEGVSSVGCVSPTRQKVTVTFLPPLPQTVVTYTGSTANTVSFSWTAVPGAASYSVSTDNGTNWVTPSSGATGTTHTVSGVGTLQSVTLLVRVNGTLACQNSISAPASGCSNSSASVVNNTVSVCTGTTATFNIQSPAAGITYNWYSAATGGTLLGTGSTFTSPAVSGTTNFYVEQVSTAGCTGSPRTQVTANILTPLAPAVITNPVAAADRTVNSVTFRWTAVPGAASYQVSIENSSTGAFTTWVTPSSGSTGLSHTVSGLTPLQHVCIKVRAIGTISCQTSEAGPVCGDARPDNIFIPNTFTPNGDSKNDVLTAYGFAIQSIQFMVFNQWGEKIHEVTTSAQNASTGEFVIWDGKYQGKVQPVGVYVYAAKITLKDGTVINKSGALNIVR